jgi:3-methyladenine DNA glycosylase AlkD
LPRNDTESVREVRRELSNKLKGASAQSVIDLALALLARQEQTTRFVAYELIHYHKKALESVKAKTLERLGAGIDNWAAVDTFACYLAGPVWRQQQISDTVIERWARSKDRWWRRAALVSTVPLNNKARGGSGDAERTLSVSRQLINDPDDMVVKGLSWALRELAKRDAESVREFLARNEQAISPRVKREVNNKLKTGLKSPKNQR